MAQFTIRPPRVNAVAAQIITVSNSAIVPSPSGTSDDSPSIEVQSFHYLNDATLYEAAVEYASVGLRVVPLHSVASSNGGCTCKKALSCGPDSGKHPRITNWQLEASNDREKIELWWSRWPDANVGLVMGGPLQLIALDVDGQCGRDSLARLESEHGPLPKTLTSRSGRPDGGEHRLLKVPPGLSITAIRNSAGEIAPGLDVRASGGQIVVAPSFHRSGQRYAWVQVAPITEMPLWLYHLMTRWSPRPTMPSAPSVPKELESLDSESVRQTLVDYLAKRSSSSDSETQEKCRLVCRVLRGEALARPGSRDTTLYRIACIIAYIVPGRVAAEDALELVYPSIECMDCEPEGEDYWVGKFVGAFDRAAAQCWKDRSRQLQRDEALIEALRGVRPRAGASLTEAHGRATGSAPEEAS